MEDELVEPINKDCELCGTYVHIELEYLAEKGCIYCYEEPEPEKPKPDYVVSTTVGNWRINRIRADWIRTLSKKIRKKEDRIFQLETALANVIDVFDNGITVDAWDEYEKKLREVLDDKG